MPSKPADPPKPAIIPCVTDPGWRAKVESYAEALRLAAPGIGAHGLTPGQFMETGLFESAVERLRGQRSAGQGPKREFLEQLFQWLKDENHIVSFGFEGGGERHDWRVELSGGVLAVIEAKGCLDGNNTTIFERPKDADEFYIWSLCQNPGADMQHNLRSGIHTRLSAEIIHKEKQVDGLIVHDMLCGGRRPCPKLTGAMDRAVSVAGTQLPPPCVYVFPRRIPSARNNPAPPVHQPTALKFVSALVKAFRIPDAEINRVRIEARDVDGETQRRTTCERGDVIQMQSGWSSIRRAT